MTTAREGTRSAKAALDAVDTVALFFADEDGPHGLIAFLSGGGS